MPRAAWLGLGAVSAAVLVEGSPLASAGVALLIAAGVILAGGALFAAHQPARAAAAMPLAAGAVAVLLRVVLGGTLATAPTTAALPDGTVAWTATVRSVSAPDGTTQPALVDAAGAEPMVSWRLWISLPRYPEVLPGDRIGFTARALPPPTDDPGFADYLGQVGAVGTAHPISVALLGPGSGPLAALERVRRALADALASVLPEPQAGLAAGLSLGLRDLVPRDVAADFATAGLSHVVAIDGWKVALIVGLLSVLVRPLPRRGRAAALIAGALAYALLGGAGASVLRAALMAVLAIASRETGRARTALATLGLTVTLLLLLEPALATEAGFQLSASATAGLVVWSRPLTATLRRWLPARLPDALVEMTALTLVAQAASLPFVLLDFGQLSPVAPVANVLVAPLVPPVMVVTTAAMVVGGLTSVGLPHLVAVPVTVVGGALLGILVAFGHLAATVPLATITLGGPAAALAAGVVALLLVATGMPPVRARVTSAARHAPWARPAVVVRPARRARPSADGAGGLSRRHVLALLTLPLAAAVAAALAVFERADGRLHATVLDVGQGDAVLVEGDCGARLLVDGGPDPDRLLAVLEARLPVWDRRLDLLILTHPHEDHVGGLAALLSRYRVAAVFEPGMLGPGPGYHAFEAVNAAAQRTTRRFTAGDRFRLDGALVNVRWPLAGSVPRLPPDTGKGINNVSIVLDIRFGQRRLLFMGDTEEEVDPNLIAADIGERPVDVLKVAHHGSGTATTAAFLDAVRPRVAIVSVGTGNPYGHPAPATIDRLRAAGAVVYRTDLDGSVEVSTDGTDLRVWASGGRRLVAAQAAQASADVPAPAAAC